MMRITDTMKNNQLLRNTMRHQQEFDKIQDQLSTGRRIRRPADDPSAATNQMYFRTRVQELDQFDNNLMHAQNRLNLVDGQLASATDILQRLRVLAVQAANGTYQGERGEDLEAIATEIDQHLRQLIEIGNQRDGTGRFLFAGHSLERPPFEAVQANIRGLNGVELENQIVSVKYQGDIGKQLREVDRNQYLDVNIPGNQVFWATNMTVTGAVDASGYRATTDQA